MADEDDTLKKIGGKAAAGAALAGATFAASNNVGASIALGVVGTVLDDVRAWVGNRRSRRLASWWESVVTASGSTPEATAERIRARLDEPAVGETILQAVRRLEDFVDDAAIPALGALTAEYLREDRKPDAFFRGTVRVLSDCDAVDIAALRYVVEVASGRSGSDRALVVFGITIDPQARPFMRKGRDSSMNRHAYLDREGLDARRVIRLLENNGLADDSPIHGGVAVELSADTIERLARVLAPVTSPDPAP